MLSKGDTEKKIKCITIVDLHMQLVQTKKMVDISVSEFIFIITVVGGGGTPEGRKGWEGVLEFS